MNKKLFWLYILSASTYFLQGIEGVPGSSLFFYLKETLHFTPEKIMYISSITGLAWLIKPIWGYLIDNFFTKKTWIYLSLVGSILISLFLGFTPFLALPLLIVLLTFGSTNTAWRDVAVDGISCIEGKQTETTGKIQAIQWGAITIASLFVGLGGGYIAEHFNYQIGFLCLVPFYLVMLWIVYHYKEHQTINCKNCSKFNVCKQHIHESLVLVTNCPNHAVMIEPCSFINNIKSYSVLFTNKKFLIACLFLFLYKYSPSFGTPLAFIERDVFGWSRMWMGTLGAIISIFEILGAILFYKYCKKINYKKWLTYSVIIGAITTLFYLYFTPTTAILYGVLFSTMGMGVHLMIMSWMAQTSIDKKEATSFALLCGISNLSATCSSISGAWLYPLIGLTPLILLSSGTSFLCLFLINKLDLK